MASIAVPRLNPTYADFVSAVRSLLEPAIHLAAPGTSWQSVRIDVPSIDPSRPFELHTEAFHAVFQAARRLRAFFAKHEEVLKQIPESASISRRAK